MNEAAQMEMPKYRCHKDVWALKIAEVLNSSEPGMARALVPEDPRYAVFSVTHEYAAKHNPQPGGYFVVYKDGYKSFSPAEAFEDGYTPAGVAGNVATSSLASTAYDEALSCRLSALDFALRSQAQGESMEQMTERAQAFYDFLRRK